MAEQKDGGSAFPNDGKWANGIHEGGMTLRDYFAAKAMQAFLSTPTGMEALTVCAKRDADKRDEVSIMASAAYEAADAMLAHRTQELNNG